MLGKRAARILALFSLVFLSLTLSVSTAVFAQTRSDIVFQGLPDNLAIAQFVNGRFLLVPLNGRIQQFDLRPDYFFTLARFSPDGRQIIGVSGRTMTVLNQRFERTWQHDTHARNIIGIALSLDGTKVAFVENDPRESTVYVETTTLARGTDEIVSMFPSAVEPPRILSWDPGGERVTLATGGRVWILDVNKKIRTDVAAGYDSSWSPDGDWIAYRSAENQLVLLDVKTGVSQITDLHLTSGVHWSPDSHYIFIDEDSSARGTMGGCITNSRFVVYRLSDKAHKVVYDPCGLRDANFGWIFDAAAWTRGAGAKASPTGHR